MANLTKCTVPTDVIGSLGTTVTERGITTQQFKDKFDEMPEGLKTYLNETLTTEIDGKFATKDTEIATLNNNITDVNTQNTQDRGFYADFAQYYNSNVVQIADCESTEGWVNNNWDSLTAGTYVANTTNYKTGSSGAKLTTTVNYGGIHLVKSLDLSKFQDGSASSTSDYISLYLYLDATSYTNLGASKFVQLLLPCDNYGTLTNFFVYNVSLAGSGDLFIKIPKSSFSSTGSPNWASIKGIHLTASGSVTGSVSVTIDNIQMVRRDPIDNTKPNPFQRCINGTWTRDFIINSGEWFLGKENGELICRELVASVTEYINALQYVGFQIPSYTEITSVKKMWSSNLKMVGDSIFYDANNFVNWTIDGGSIFIVKRVNGSQSFVTLPISVAIGDIITAKFIKSGSNYTLNVVKNGDTTNIYSLTTSANISLPVGYYCQQATNSSYTMAVTTKCLGISTTSHSTHCEEAEYTKNNAILYKAGAFTTADLPVGAYGIDTTNNRLYFKLPSGTLKYVTLT